MDQPLNQKLRDTKFDDEEEKSLVMVKINYFKFHEIYFQLRCESKVSQNRKIHLKTFIYFHFNRKLRRNEKRSRQGDGFPKLQQHAAKHEQPHEHGRHGCSRYMIFVYFLFFGCKFFLGMR